MKYIKHIILTAMAVLLTAGQVWAMQLYVITPSGQVTLEVEPSDSFENIKAKIEDKTGFNPTYQHLYYNHIECYNGQTLNEVGITSGGQTLTMTYDFIPARQADGSWKFTMPAANKLLEVENYNTYTLTLASNDNTMGTVKIDSAGGISFLDSVSVKDAAANEYYVLPGAKVAVKAIPAAGYQLLKWEDNSTDLTRTVTVTSDTTLIATFGLPNPGLTPEGELTTSGTRFLDEYGDIVGTPRITETGELIDNSALPVHLIGKFSVSGTKKVYFSPANLQYTRTSTSVDWSTGTWSFMPHQYSIVETEANPYCTVNYGDKTAVGLMGWGTWGEGKTPNLTSTSNANYTWSTDFSGSLGGYSDWRTLTKDEWTYLLSTRATSVTVNSTNNARYTLATINTGAGEVKGMIVFPDGFTGSNTEGVTWGTINAASDYTTTCTSVGWNALEAANCLFLPAAGWRAKNDNNTDGTKIGGINLWGYYWTSDPWDNSTDEGNDVVFDKDKVKSDDHAQRRFGFSVRLVRDAE